LNSKLTDGWSYDGRSHAAVPQAFTDLRGGVNVFALARDDVLETS
jgi:hypothetical protein